MVAPTFQITPETLQAGLELVPVPAAHLVRQPDGWAFEAVNRAFRLTGLSVTAGGSRPPRAMFRLVARLPAIIMSRHTRWGPDPVRPRSVSDIAAARPRAEPWELHAG